MEPTLRRIAAALALVTVASGPSACQKAPPAAVDLTAAPAAEALVRKQLGLPAGATLKGLAATASSPQTSALPAALSTYLAGPQQTSGLRVVAAFDLPLADVESEFWTDWQPLPLPPAVAAFREPPAELAGLTGYYRCETRAWSPGRDDGWAPGSCASPPANFDSYEAAVYDPQSGRLTVVLKRYY